MNRRGFLQAILLACSAPAICKIDNLMKIAAVEPHVLHAVDLNSLHIGDVLTIDGVWGGLYEFKVKRMTDKLIIMEPQPLLRGNTTVFPTYPSFGGKLPPLTSPSWRKL